MEEMMEKGENEDRLEEIGEEERKRVEGDEIAYCHGGG